MKVYVSEMTEKQLDWAVGEIMETAGEHRPYCPSTDWSEGGPIIERERIDIIPLTDGYDDWSSYVEGVPYSRPVYGETPLIAAMRAFVASKLGDVVEVPE